MKPGDKVGRYILGEGIGEGAMAQVFASSHPVLDRRVAVKVLKKEACHDPHYVARFLDDARAAHALDHPNIVRVLDVDDSAAQPFIVMELVDGSSLDHWLPGRRLEVGEAVRIARDVARALDVAHRAGMVHRDIKPSNVLIDHQTAVVKLTDFGAAKRERPGAAQLTEMGQRIGTPRYMAPEQIDGGAVDARADLFALGATLYELLANRPAFEGETVSAVFHAILFGQPRPLAEDRPEAAPELIRLVERLLSKAPNDRPTSASEVAAALDEFVTGVEPTPMYPAPAGPRPVAGDRTVISGGGGDPTRGTVIRDGGGAPAASTMISGGGGPAPGAVSRDGDQPAASTMISGGGGDPTRGTVIRDGGEPAASTMISGGGNLPTGAVTGGGEPTTSTASSGAGAPVAGPVVPDREPATSSGIGVAGSRTNAAGVLRYLPRNRLVPALLGGALVIVLAVGTWWWMSPGTTPEPGAPKLATLEPVVPAPPAAPAPEVATPARPESETAQPEPSTEPDTAAPPSESATGSAGLPLRQDEPAGVGAPAPTAPSETAPQPVPPGPATTEPPTATVQLTPGETSTAPSPAPETTAPLATPELLASLDCPSDAAAAPGCALAAKALRALKTPLSETPTLTLNRPNGIYLDHDYLVIDTKLPPDVGGYLYLDVLTDAGSVYHMLPEPMRTDNQLPSGGQIRVGIEAAEQRPGVRFWEVGEPFGKGYVLAMVSKTPLYQGLRPIEESIADYQDVLLRTISDPNTGKKSGQVERLEFRPRGG